MKRTASLTRKTWMGRGNARLERSPAAGPITPKITTRKGLQRTRFKWKRRRPKPGDDPKYKAWVKTQPCVVGGWLCGRADPHHIIDGRGAQRKGMAQTARDKDALPLCRAHHDQFHDHVGFCVGWTKERRRIFQEQEIERLNKIWDDLCELGILQEPMRESI